MDFEKKVPEWNAAGTEPPESLKNDGFQAGYKPPAPYFNWFWYTVSACLKEIQAKMKQVRAVVDGGTGKGSVTAGSYLVGNGTGALAEKTPEEVRSHIGASQQNYAIPTVAATSDDGITYNVTVPGVTELYNGLIITIIPERVSASTAVKINVNNLGEKMLRLPLSFNNAAMSIPKMDTYFTQGRPITIQYDANYTTGGAWKTLGKQKTSAQDLYGTVPIEGGGTDADNAADARKNLDVPSNADIEELRESMLKKAAYDVSLPASGWSDSAPYSQVVSVSGILASDTPFVDLNMSNATTDTAADMQEAFAMIGRIVTADGKITAYCYDSKPAADLPLRLMVVR